MRINLRGPLAHPSLPGSGDGIAWKAKPLTSDASIEISRLVQSVPYLSSGYTYGSVFGGVIGLSWICAGT